MQNLSRSKKLFSLKEQRYLAAFQAKDDILSRVSSAEETGKSSIENKVSFPYFFETMGLAMNEAKNLSTKAKGELLNFNPQQIQLFSEIADYAVNRKK